MYETHFDATKNNSPRTDNKYIQVHDNMHLNVISLLSCSCRNYKPNISYNLLLNIIWKWPLPAKLAVCIPMNCSKFVPNFKMASVSHFHASLTQCQTVHDKMQMSEISIEYSMKCNWMNWWLLISIQCTICTQYFNLFTFVWGTR